MVATTQTVRNLASDLADAFDWDQDKVKVVAPTSAAVLGRKQRFDRNTFWPLVWP